MADKETLIRHILKRTCGNTGSPDVTQNELQAILREVLPGRCGDCRWWTRDPRRDEEGGCERIDAAWRFPPRLGKEHLARVDGHQYEDAPAEFITHAEFGCVQWEKEAEVGDGTRG